MKRNRNRLPCSASGLKAAPHWSQTEATHAGEVTVQEANCLAVEGVSCYPVPQQAMGLR